jgi:ABC-type Fe3+-siderophore transport system permease subunit
VVWLIVIIGITGIFSAILLAPKINAVNLGDEVAIGLGVNPTPSFILNTMHKNL